MILQSEMREGVTKTPSLESGEAGIRTLGTLAGTPHFECGAFDHSATSPLIATATSNPGSFSNAGA